MNSTLSLFALAALVTVATPGPTVLLALNNGARWGVRAALPGIIGAMLSDMVLVAAVAAGLGGLLSASVLAFELLRWAGVVYLAWLGLQLLRAGNYNAASTAEPDRQASPWLVLRRSLTVALSNPKGYLFFSALLPSFIDANAPLLPQYAMLTLVFAAIDGAVMLLYATAGAMGGRRVVGRSMRWVDRASGCALLIVAAGLALWRRPTSAT